jgi:protein O-mannosyl-transferase
LNPRRQVHLLAVLTIVVAALAAYANTFRVPFVFDDVSSILDNPTLRQLWPPGEALSPPSNWGLTVSGRPLLNYSLAVNQAISGREVWSYHALNLLIHALAGLTLLGVVRRILIRLPAGHSLAEKSVPLAWAISFLWTLHPLQTESVTYVVQRAESLMGLWFLLTLYAFLRAADSPRPRRWWAVSFGACLLGVGTKEIAALAPVMVFLCDRTFVSGTFRDAWRRHRWIHLSLASTWLPLAFLLAGTGGNRGGTVGFNLGRSWSDYWLTQFEAITRYLGLAFWPAPLVFDYGKIPPPPPGTALLWAIPVVALLIATVVALVRWPAVGFLGAWFFALLAPTSLVPGAQQMIVEHRLYLSLAAVIALALGAVAGRCTVRSFLAVAVTLSLAAGIITARRNADYRNARTLWEDTVAKRPANARAHNNLGLVLYQSGEIDGAILHYRESLRLDDTDALAHYNLGLALMKSGRLAEAVAPFTAAVQSLPAFYNAQTNLGIVLTKLGRAAEALPHFGEALRFDPAPAEVHFQLGVALASLARWFEAIEHYAAAVVADPRHAEAQSNWGVALVERNDLAGAIAHFNEALRLKPGLAEAHFNLALVFAKLGRGVEAIAQYAEAARLDPGHADAQLNLGILLAQSGKLAEGIEHLEQASKLRPDSPEAHTNLALAYLTAGRGAEALQHYETALRLRPRDPQSQYNLGYALLVAERWSEAQTRFEEALKLNPGFVPAREMLQRLRQASPP